MLSCTDIRAEARKQLKGHWKQAAIVTLIYSVILAGMVFIPIESFISVESCMPVPYQNIIKPPLKQLISALLMAPLTLGFTIFYLKLARNEAPRLLDLFSGFRNYIRALLSSFAIILVLELPNIIIGILYMLIYALMLLGDDPKHLAPIAIISMALLPTVYFLAFAFTVYLMLTYSQVYFILADNPKMKITEIFRNSENIMQGYMLKLLGLYASFIGWILLAGIIITISFYIMQTLHISISIPISVLSIGITSLLAPYMTTASACFYKELSHRDKSKN